MFTKEDIVAEAKRCLNCKNAPCVAACPAHNPIPRFMQSLKLGLFQDALSIWDEKSNLPEICGRLCQNETLCVGHCTMNKVGRPLQIGILEAAVADLFLGKITLPNRRNGRRHLVVGLGPSGIANALEMAKAGYSVECIDANKNLGGALENLIPEFRFDKYSMAGILVKIHELGIRTRFETRVGTDVMLSDLIPSYDSVYVACGSDLPQPSDIESGNLPVYYAHDLLNRNRYQPEDLLRLVGSSVFVVGLGNVAVDMARTLGRQGVRVTIVYRRTIDEAPAGKHEIAAAMAEGIDIQELLLPKRFHAIDGRRYLDCERTAVLTDATGKRSVESLPGLDVTFQADDVIFATGQRSSDTVFAKTGIVCQSDLSPYATNHPKVFVGGDRINKNKRIVDAMVSGIEAARLIQGEKP